MKRKKWMHHLRAGLFVIMLAGGSLSGCSGQHREKIILPETKAENKVENKAENKTENRTEHRTETEQEIVIEIEAETEEAAETVRETAETVRETAEETETVPEASKQEVSEASEPEKTTAKDYEAGAILSVSEIQSLGTDTFFYQTSIGEGLYQRMKGRSYKSGCPVALEELRYLRVLHWGYQDEIRVGELVCSQSISEDLLAIFRKLYDAHYPIEKMRLIDDYDGDDDWSSSDNNTSCFNYRNVAGTESLSRHAFGIAIDINPVQNPYVVTDQEGTVTCAPANGSRYADRSQSFPHKIEEGDLCCRLFTEAGFTWGGSWQDGPDYMHFSKGSTPET